MRANFDVQYWLHVGQTNSDSQPMTSKAKNRSWWYSEPVSFSSFNNDIETIVYRIEASRINLTAKYNDWLDIGFALAHEFGEKGRTYFHRISRFDPRFSQDRCNKQYDTCLKATQSSRDPKIAINTFYHLVKQAGIDIYGGFSNVRVLWKETMVPPMNEPTVSVTLPEPPEKEDLIFNTPQLPGEIYSQLPEILRESCLLFQEGIEQDVFLISSLTVLSGCFPNIEGIYFDQSYSAHLFAFITAPAGSGKGKMNWAKYFGQAIHDHLTEQSRIDHEVYERNLEKYYNLTRAQRQKVEKPVEPSSKMFFLPANSSSAAFIQALAGNNYRAVIFETEADTLANTLKQEWGNFSDVVRKGFHHESTSMFRKKDNKCIEIKDPHMAIGLGGTPNQVHRLMPNLENGLFSRFLFYAFEDHSDFKNPFISHCPVNYAEFLTEKGKQIFGLYRQLNKLAQPIQFKLTEEQGNKFTVLFSEMLSRNQLLIGRDFNANIKRLGLITFRIAMILSALRLLEEDTQLVTPGGITERVTTSEKSITDQNHQFINQNSHPLSPGNTLICNDRDYETAIIIAATLEKHAIAVYQNMPNNGLQGKPLSFFEKLPQQFDRQGYLKVAEELGIQPKAAEKYITQFKLRLLHHEHNLYTKI
jgi:hypothetical protein